MAKAYHAFKAAKFPGRDSFSVPKQSNFLDIELPDTSLNKTYLPISEDFVTYYVHHELIIQQIGRSKGVEFTHFAAPFEFYLFFRKSDNLVLIQTNKKVCNSLVHDLIGTGSFDIKPFVVDFDILQPHVSYVKGAWFKFKEPDRTASAHFGNHVDRSAAYQESLEEGELSSMHLLHSYMGETLQIQITEQCGIVLFHIFEEAKTELSVVLSVYDMLESINALSVSKV